MAYVIGGIGVDDGMLPSMERYDALTGQWNAMAAMNTARHSYGACVIAGEIYVTGGRDESLSVLSSIERYSPLSDSRSTIVPLPDARAGHGAVTVGSAMYVLGGCCKIDGVTRDTASALKFDSAHGTWSEIAPLPAAIYNFTACAIDNDIYVFGGLLGHVDQASVFRYDTITNMWSTLAPMSEPSAYHSAIALDGLISLVGVGTMCRKLYQFDPASNVWTTLASPGHSEEPANFLLGGRLYVAGGLRHGARTLRYEVMTDTWTPVSDMLEGRQCSGAVTIGVSDPVEEEQNLFNALIDKATSEGP
jgi:N-acetylneuraminic acid mutarotase